MRTVRVVNDTRGSVLGDEVEVADWWWPRLKGLLWTDALPEGEGLLLIPCRGVHMYGMTFPLDVAFLDEERRVTAIYRGLAPGTRSRWHGEARAALEVPDGRLASTGTMLGDELSWSETDGRETG